MKSKRQYYELLRNAEPQNVTLDDLKDILEHIDSCNRKNINPEDWDFLWVVAKRFVKYVELDLRARLRAPIDP